MNISSISPALSATTPADGAGLLVMKKALDTLSRDGQDLVALLQQSAPPAVPASPPHLGNTVDIKA